MKKRIALLLFTLVSSLVFADTCPFIYQFTPDLPPGGWSILSPAIFPGKHYRFISATHSLNTTLYALQTLCLYQCGPDEINCSPFTLLSNATFRLPNSNISPWNIVPNMLDTVVCAPSDNNPLECIFSN